MALALSWSVGVSRVINGKLNIKYFLKLKFQYNCKVCTQTHTNTHTPTPHTFFIRSSVDGHLGCFCILNKAKIFNPAVYLCIKRDAADEHYCWSYFNHIVSSLLSYPFLVSVLLASSISRLFQSLFTVQHKS